MGRTLKIVTTCQATVTETWTYEVPDGVEIDIDAEDFDQDQLKELGASFIGCDEESSDEHDRETQGVWWDDEF